MAQGLFPLDKQLGLNRTGYSAEFAKEMVWLSGLLPYEQCTAVFARIGKRWVPASSIWRQTQQHGERMQTVVEQAHEQVSMEHLDLPDARYDHHQRKAASIDGGMVNIRGEGWRELKVGAVFDVEMRLERNPQTQKLEEMAHGVDVHYTAVLGSKDAFMPALWALAVEHELPTAKECAVIGDGALWIWNVVEEILPDSREIVDWFHAVEHLAKAATALYPDEEDGQKRKRWLKTYKTHLYEGRVRKIISVLHKRGRDDLALYFERHQQRMSYPEFRKEGFPIGSGTVESGVKQFKQRLCGTGMRWNRDCTIFCVNGME